MKRYFLYSFYHQGETQYTLVDTQTNTRTVICDNASKIFIDKLSCIYPIKNISNRVRNIIADADSIEELLYQNPELLL